jgi:hypothetical protein
MKMVPKMETFIQQPTAFKNILYAATCPDFIAL